MVLGKSKELGVCLSLEVDWTRTLYNNREALEVRSDLRT